MKTKIDDMANCAYPPEVESAAFVMLSGKLGETFFNTPKQKRKIEDYGKLMGICVVFEFKRMLLKLTREGESVFDEILDYLKEEGKKPQIVKSWINEAIENIADPQLKNIATGLWEEKKLKTGEKAFDLINML